MNKARGSLDHDSRDRPLRCCSPIRHHVFPLSFAVLARLSCVSECTCARLGSRLSINCRLQLLLCSLAGSQGRSYIQFRGADTHLKNTELVIIVKFLPYMYPSHDVYVSLRQMHTPQLYSSFATVAVGGLAVAHGHHPASIPCANSIQSPAWHAVCMWWADFGSTIKVLGS